MHTIKYELLQHKGENRIAVLFAYDALLHARIKKVDGSKWSQSKKCWHIPDTVENRLKCKLALTNGDEHYPIKANSVLQTNQIKRTPAKPVVDEPSKTAMMHLCAANKQEMQRFLEHLQLHAYSESTITTYKNEFAQLLKLLGEVCVCQIEPQHLQRYMVWCVKQGLSEHTIYSRLNAFTPLD